VKRRPDKNGNGRREAGSDRNAYLKAHRCPRGELGRTVARRMNRHHAPLRAWGLARFAPPPGALVLDIGCGGGATARDILRRPENYSVIGIDLSEDMARYSRRRNPGRGRAAFVAAAADGLPFPSGAFAAVTAFETTYFWADLVEAAAEIGRVLAPGGTLLIVNELYLHPKFSAGDRELTELIGMEVCTPERYRSLLEKAGLTVLGTFFADSAPWIALVAGRGGDAA